MIAASPWLFMVDGDVRCVAVDAGCIASQSVIESIIILASVLQIQ